MNLANKNLNELVKPYIKSLSTPEIKLYCDELNKFNVIKNIIQKLISIYKTAHIIKIDGIRVETENFWFLVRASNTQNCLVFRLEHFDVNKFKSELNKIIKIFSYFDLDIKELINFNNTV